MKRRQPRTKRTETIFPNTTLYRCVPGGAIAGAASVDGEQYVHCILLVWGRVGPACSVSSPPSCRSEEHTSELQSLMRISYAVFCLTNKLIFPSFSFLYFFFFFFFFFLFFLFFFFLFLSFSLY